MSELPNLADQKPPSVDRLSQLWHRINDHKMVQWTIGYVGLAYAIQHGVVLTREAFEWPQAVERISMLLLVLGLPLVMTFAWYHGERASRQFTKAELSILSALLVMSSLLFYAFVRPTEEATAGSKPAVQQAGVAARAASATQAGAISIAVLPFENLSGDAGQEFFSDGMTEEITAALAKIPDLRVVARTSAFQFKAQNRDIQSIGQQLHASHFLEGSVRKAGNRLRITAQLIQAADGVHVWAENYDRELTDIFAVQEDIATAIAGALRTPLGLKQGERLVSNRSIDPQSYQQYLRAKALVRARGVKRLSDAAALLEEVVARDPDFAPAWALLALAYDLTPTYHPARVSGSVEEFRRVVDNFLPKAETAAQRAIRLDSNLADGQSSLAHVLHEHGKVLPAEELYLKALKLDPTNPDALTGYSLLLASVGRVKEALPLRQALLAEEPFVPNFTGNTAVVQWLNGQTEIAIATLNTLTRGDSSRGLYLPRIYATAARFKDAADALGPATLYPPGAMEEAARLLRTAPTRVPSPQNLPRLGNLGFVYLYVGAPDRMLEFYEDGLQAGYSVNVASSFLWHPSYGPIRKTERFKAYARKAGLVEYWRAKGWPELCHPTTADDFQCN